MKALIVLYFLVPSFLYCTMHEEYVQKFAVNLFSNEIHEGWETLKKWEKEEPKIQEAAENFRYLLIVMETDFFFGTSNFDVLLVSLDPDSYSYSVVQEVKVQYEIAWNVYYIQGERLLEFAGKAS